MIRNYFKIAWRNLTKRKLFSVINILGLSTGLACVFLISFWVYDELRVDAFHENGDMLVQVMKNDHLANSVETGKYTPDLLSETIATEFLEVKNAVSVSSSDILGDINVSNGNTTIKVKGQHAHQDFFDIFSFPLLDGNPNEVLKDKSGIVISEKLALKLFNTTDDVIGKTLKYDINKFTYQAIITGVFKDVVLHSSQQFDLVLPYESWITLLKDFNASIHWGNSRVFTYLVLNEGVNLELFNARLEGFLKTKNKDLTATLFATPYNERYLYSGYENGKRSGGRISYVRFFLTVALFILVIACINYMNLSTAMASKRSKEVGIKKVLGANRANLMLQYFSESILIAFLSFVLALVLVLICIQPFNLFTGKQVSLFENGYSILYMLAISLFTGLLAGSYPALYLSKFNPITVLKGKLKNSIVEVWVRKGLVAFQFGISILMIVGVVIVYKQLQHLQSKNIGYNRNNVIHFEMEKKVLDKPKLFLSKLKEISGVVNASSTSGVLMGIHSSTDDIEWKGKLKDDNFKFAGIDVDYQMLETMGIEMKTGRTFLKDFGAEKDKIIFNQKAIEAMGLKEPVVGQYVYHWGRKKQIVGVTKNFHFESLHNKIEPLFFLFNPYDTSQIFIKLTNSNQATTLKKIENFYKTFNDSSEFDYKFLDTDYEKLYKAENTVSSLTEFFAVLAIIISCLGLFAMVTFSTEQKSKEIALRKVLGASLSRLVLTISGEFTKIITLSMIIAIPVGVYLSDQWLGDFAYRIEIKWWFFALVGLFTLLISGFVIGLQAIKSAIVNPIKSLRTE